jgi:hypothetical protein
MSFSKKLTNKFDSISDLYGRKEARDSLVFDAMVNSLSSPYGDTQLFGVILMIETQGILGPDGTTLPTTPNPTHPFVITARVRPLAPAAESFNLEEPCKFKSDPAALYENLMQHPIAYSETLDGDESLFIPTVGDVVPIYYDLEGPTSSGKKRGLRFKMQRVRRAEGGFDATCLAALGAKLVDGKISLSRVGTPAAVIGAGGFGGAAGAGTGIGGGGSSGLGVTAATGALVEFIKKDWPSGIVGVEVGKEASVKPPSKNAWKNALKQRSWWMNKAYNPLWPRVPYGIMGQSRGKAGAKMNKPNIITLMDCTLTGKEKNLWTYDITDPASPKLLVYTFGGIGFSSFGNGVASGMSGGSSRKAPTDFANGNSHTSAGMKVFGGYRSYHSMSRKSGAIHIWGLHPWSGNEEQRGAIGHETGGKGRAFNTTTGPRESKSRPRSAGCIATAFTVHYNAREIWKGGSWCYFWIGHEDESVANNNYYKGLSGKPYHKYEKRQSWDWGSPFGGHGDPDTTAAWSSKVAKKRAKRGK